MNILDAAEKVLLERGVPMPIDNIADIILRNGLWTSAGKTPKVSIASRLYVDMKENGAKSRFVKTRAGMIDIRNAESLFSCEDLPSEGLSWRDRAALKKFVADIYALSAEEFEAGIRKVLEDAGIGELERISRRKRDEVNFAGYVTILGTISVRIRVLAARWKRGAVTSLAVDRIRRDIVPGDRAAIFSVGGFSKEAVAAAASDGEPPIALFDAEDMERMLKL